MGYKRYEKYKDSGVEWIGEIPEHWEILKLKNILLINDGGTWGEESDDEEGTIILRSTEIKIDGSWDLQEPARRKLSPKEKKRCLLKTGDLLVTKSSGSEQHIGKTAIVNKDIERLKCAFSNFMQRLRVNRNTCPKFVYYFINSYVGRTQLQYLSTTTTGLGNITSQILNAIIIPYGGYDEQTAIANFLDHKTTEIDSLIADKEKLIQLLQEKRQAIITEAVTKGLDPNIPMKDSGVEWIGKIPEHWNITRVKYICSESAIYGLNETANNYEDEGVRLIRTTDINEYGNLDDKINGVFISEEKAKGYILKTGDILVSRSGSLGLSLYFDEKKYGKCSYASYLVKFRTNRYNHPRYLFYFTKSESFYHQIQTALVSSTISNFNGQKYANMKLPLPSYHEQKAIANFLDQKTAEIDSLISDIQNQIAKLKEYRQSLIYEAVTGKIDVRDFTSNTEGVVLDAKNTN
ncbi:MAG TPA: restriction endonuclease subunit S [Candidatus Hydrothermia bacterium]|nr:restriction endonuclease subunit S [Thermodesulfovibrio thiophilus]HOP33414.1 restriction endonuclease subunit S [Candidatus Hydrothermia bacterium]